MTRKNLLRLKGKFYQALGYEVFIETSKGNFIWNDPFFAGDNHITKTNKTLEQWDKDAIIQETCLVKDFCGGDIILEK